MRDACAYMNAGKVTQGVRIYTHHHTHINSCGDHTLAHKQFKCQAAARLTVRAGGCECYVRCQVLLLSGVSKSVTTTSASTDALRLLSAATLSRVLRVSWQTQDLPAAINAPTRAVWSLSIWMHFPGPVHPSSSVSASANCEKEDGVAIA